MLKKKGGYIKAWRGEKHKNIHVESKKSIFLFFSPFFSDRYFALRGKNLYYFKTQKDKV